ncbi:MAG: hypothetical protein LUQ11_02310 [Methylococcaceae bacterium]|nr:hypothetical protein [Methylococcaceae bacterium]
MQINRFIRMWLFAIAISLLSTACSGPQSLRLRSEVDSLAAPEARGKTHFVILPGNKEVNEQDLQFLEFKSYVEKVLATRGFSKASSLENGDVVLFLSYGVGPPETQQYSYDVPVWMDSGYYYPYYRRSRFYSGVSAYTQRIESYTTYKRYLVLEAYDMAQYRQEKLVQIWKTSVNSSGTSADLRLVFPYMAAAMQPYIGSNTGHMVSIDIDEQNPLLRELLWPVVQSSPVAVPAK